MSFGKKKLTRKELEEKISNLLIETQRRIGARDAKIAKLEKAVGEIQKASDIVMGYVIRAYGYEAGDRLMLDLPKCDERYHISLKRTETGYLLTATEVKDEIQEQESNN